MSISNQPENLTVVARELEPKGPEAILEWATTTFGAGLVIATGFGPEGVVNLHLISQIDPTVKVFYLETCLFFKETHVLRHKLSSQLGLTIEAVSADLSLEQQAILHGENLWENDPNLCCYLRKVVPLRRYLANKQAWVTGIRREQTPARATVQIVEWDQVNALVKINPLVSWSADQVWQHIQEHDLPFNALHRQGYPSVGCWPCTRAVQPGEDPRAGRWAGHAKTECGLHVARRSKWQEPAQLPRSGQNLTRHGSINPGD